MRSSLTDRHLFVCVLVLLSCSASADDSLDASQDFATSFNDEASLADQTESGEILEPVLDQDSFDDSDDVDKRRFDRFGFAGGIGKRESDLFNEKRRIDRFGFAGGIGKRRIDRYGFSGGIGKRDVDFADMDEELEKRRLDKFGFAGGIGKRRRLDRFAFSGGIGKRRFDRYGFAGGIGKRRFDRMGFSGGLGKRRLDRFGFAGGIGKRKYNSGSGKKRRFDRFGFSGGIGKRGSDPFSFTTGVEGGDDVGRAALDKIVEADMEKTLSEISRQEHKSIGAQEKLSAKSS